MTGSGIHHFAAQSIMESISEEFPGDCFDFDRPSASSLGRSVLKREQKEGGEIFNFVDLFQHRDVFSKELLGEFCQLQPVQRSFNRFPVEMYLVFPL